MTKSIIYKCPYCVEGGEGQSRLICPVCLGSSKIWIDPKHLPTPGFYTGEIDDAARVYWKMRHASPPFPATYPPELHTPWGKCKRCEGVIGTGHRCLDLRDK